MSFSENYLNKMLNSAINYSKFKNENITSLPNTYNNKTSALNLLKKSLYYEANQNLKEPIKPQKPLLCVVNIKTDEPGIVIGKNKDKLCIHTQYKIEKKSVKQTKNYSKEKLNLIADKEFKKLQKQKEKLLEKLNKKKEKKAKEIEYKELIKTTKQNIKNKNNFALEILNFENNNIKTKKTIEKLNKQPNKNISEIEQLKNNFNSNNNNIKNLKNKLELIQDNITNDSTKINEYESNKQEEKELREQKKQEKILKNAKDTESKKKKNVAKNPKKALLNQIDNFEVFDDLYNEVTGKNITNNELVQNDYKELNQNEVNIYSSPVPHERHIEALNRCNPNPVILTSLLYGDNKFGNDFIKIFHGPPGTGKTWRLINELKNLLLLSPREKILICAPSNIGVINLYNRALSSKIYGCLILSAEKYPKKFENHKKRKNNIVFSTISMRHSKYLLDLEFSTIIVDEAAQCPESWIWGLLRHKVSKLYMAGDPYQLPALVSEKGKELYHDRSLMERLINLKFPCELLNVQRRMHPKIVAFSNKEFYNNKLKTDYNGNYNIQPLKIININGKEVKLNNSYYNKEECLEIIKQVKHLKSTFNDIVIISPYKAQCNYLCKLDKNLIIHTVDSFQGREADAIILTTVRTGNTMGFWNDYRRLNVALTRAKHCLRIIGHTNSWKKSNNKLSALL